MKKRLIFSIIICFQMMMLSSHICYGQIQFNYQRIIGGDSSDYSDGINFESGFHKIGINPNKKSKYICTTTKSPISADKNVGLCTNTNYIFNYDIWVLEVDSNNQISNQVDLGGRRWEEASIIVVDSTHQCLYVVCVSDSYISCNKTSPKFGGGDIWVVKLDYNLNVIWDRSYGGNGIDRLYCATLDAEGNIYIAFSAGSTLGGNITAPYLGASCSASTCVFKVDPFGNTVWNKFIGATYGEVEICDIQQLPDKGFVLVGVVYNWGAGGSGYVYSPLLASGDAGAYILRVDSNFNYINDTRFGGQRALGSWISYSMIAVKCIVKNTGLVIACYVDSLITSNLAPVNFRGGLDIMILETDWNGNLYNNHCYGGSGDDFITNLEQDSLGNYYVFSTSNSNSGVDKSENSKGGHDLWILKLDSAFNKMDDITIGTTGDNHDASGLLVDNQIMGMMTVNYNSGGDFTLNTINTISSDVWLFGMDTNLSVGVNELNSHPNLQLFPNPASNSITIKGLIGKSDLFITDLQGRVVTDFAQVQQSEFKVDISNFASGMYILKYGATSAKFVKE